MAKKMMKRSLALGALMAFVITGSAYAENLDRQNLTTEVVSGIYDDLAGATVDIVKTGGVSVIENADITVTNGGTLTIESSYVGAPALNGGVVNNSTIDSNGLVVLKQTGNEAALTGLNDAGNTVKITAKEIQIKSNSFGVYVSQGGRQVEDNIELNADKISIDSKAHGVYAVSVGGIKIDAAESLTVKTEDGAGILGDSATGNVEVTTGKLVVESTNKNAIGAINSGNVTITADSIDVTAKNLEGEKAYKNSVIGGDGNITLKVKDTLKVNNDGTTGNAIEAREGSTITINGTPTIQVDGNVEATKGTLNGFDVSGEDSYVNGTINAGDKADISFSDGATWNNNGDSNVSDLKIDGGNINMTGEGAELTVKNVTVGEKGANVQFGDEDQKVTFAENGENNINGDLTASASKKYSELLASNNMEESAKKLAAQLGNKADTVEIQETDVAGKYTATMDGDKVVSAIEAVNADNQAVTEANVNVKAMWRAHMNDMNKRMGELRNSNGEHGVWVRMTRGEMSYKGDKAQYNQYQLGYDEKLSVNKAWTVGAAVTFAEGDSSFVNGGTDDKSTAFAIYGSKLNNDGTFIDLIARAAHMESDVTVSSKVGDYDANGYSVSAEFGKRIKNDNGCWIEPQVELTYGTVQESKFKLGDSVDVTMGDMDSFIGRLGFALGKDIKAGNVYARASYLYDFDGETDATYSNGKVTRPHESDLGGGWWEVGVGANINLSKATYVYADMEKTFGGELNTDWQWNLGVRYSF